MKISGAIFDLDGTLIDSMPLWDNLVKDFLAEHGVEAAEEEHKKIMTMTMDSSTRYIHENLLSQFSPEELKKQIEGKIWTAYSETLPIKHGVKPFLFALRNKGVRMCIATSSPRILAEAVLKRLNIMHYFCCILTCDELKTTKNTPDIYNRAIDILGTPNETTYVFEDAIHAIRTAKAAGFNVAAIEDESMKNFRDEIKALANMYIRDYDDFRGQI